MTGSGLCRQGTFTPDTWNPVICPHGPRLAARFSAASIRSVMARKRSSDQDRCGDLLLLAEAWGCQAAIWYSWMSPPTIQSRRKAAKRTKKKPKQRLTG